ncbi:hypothetical protein THERU_00935 [Thermocrinis ruber]|uniref:DUF8082 domain-containing protein n=1 Tax=Thermocrinis ruber TaxID=75906 RepID=W0DAD1_9AQUI|nr:hypothetical protein [Thermocrinis ruber]AHE95459.1 hypothetical protein THERU_00935 [Thermocrinis ruber]
MQRIELYKDLNLESVNLKEIFREIQDKSESGYLKITYWDQEDYIFYAGGKPIGGATYDRQGRKMTLDYLNYRIRNYNGTLSFYKLPTLEVLVFKYKELKFPTPYNFVSYGDEFLAPVKTTMVDPNRVLQQVKRSHLNGYIVIGDDENYKCMLFLQGGNSIAFYNGKQFIRKGNVRFSVKRETDYVGVYSTEPEFSLLLSCMDTLKLDEEYDFKSKEELEAIEKSITSRKSTCLLDATLSNGDRLYQFFYSGAFIVRILHSREELASASRIDIKPGTENRLKVFSIDVPLEIGSVNVEFVYEDADRKVYTSYVPEDKVTKLKKFFIEEIGPIGSFLWNRILKSNGLDEAKLSKDDFEKLVNILRDEIPDERHRDKFIEKVRRLET